MKKNNLFLLIVLLAGLFTACEKDKEEEPVVNEELETILANIECKPVLHIGEKQDILGKWLLVESRCGIENREFADRSCERIIYEFFSDGRLVVTGNDEHHLNGEYTYTYSPWNSRSALPGPNLFFLEWRCLGVVHENYMNIIEGGGNLWGETFLRIE